MRTSSPPDQLSRFLSRALPVLQGDARLVGVAVGGSWLTGELDEFSDLDLVVVAAPSEYASVSASKLELAGSLGSLLSAFTGEHVGEPRLLICLYEAPLLHVDLKFVSLADFDRRVEDPVILWQRESALTAAMSVRPAIHPQPDPQWIEDRFWTWVHYAATKLGRGELFEVIDFLAFLRGQVLAPLAAIGAGLLPRGVRKIERTMPAYARSLERTLAAHEATSCADALFAAVELYRSLRAGGTGVVVRTRAEEAAVEYLGAVAARARP